MLSFYAIYLDDVIVHCLIDQLTNNFIQFLQVVQMNKLPLILTFVGAENCNTGHILALDHQLDAHLEDMKLAVTEA